MLHSKYKEVRGRLFGLLLPPCEFQGLNSGLQACQQVPLPAELFCWPKPFVFSNTICPSVHSLTQVFIQGLYQGQTPSSGAGETEALWGGSKPGHPG